MQSRVLRADSPTRAALGFLERRQHLVKGGIKVMNKESVEQEKYVKTRWVAVLPAAIVASLIGPILVYIYQWFLRPKILPGSTNGSP